MQNLPQHKKYMTSNTDVTNADSPNTADDDATDALDYDGNVAVYPKWIHLYLRNLNYNRKITPNTKIFIKIT